MTLKYIETRIHIMYLETKELNIVANQPFNDLYLTQHHQYLTIMKI